MPLLRESRDDFLALIAATAADISYPLAWVEKDYWITEVLRSLAEPLEDYAVVFKGGTSLSKAWRLIQRMSQDVDILLVPPDGASTGARDRALKAITKRAGEAITAAPTLAASGIGVHRATIFSYSAMFGDPTVAPEVLMEIGVRGGPDPNERKTVRSLLAEYALRQGAANAGEFDEFSALEICCLKPERTLVEKLSAVHQLATKAASGAEIKLGTSMRHYYDISMLLRSDAVRDELRAGTFATIAEDVDARSAAAGWEYTARPATGYGESPAFSESFLMREDVRAAYARVHDLVVGGATPELDTVADEVRAVAQLL